ncbi:hypothetical protein [Martelella soudanensis]|uniref:hypothetical protein n=1 Tax=unclassified Martelella TaxID=2629616 RepID=UPI0015DDD422|nr:MULTISPECIES: hypothetical protein [unclassified Martelella]
MAHYKCSDCMMVQNTGRVCRRCGSYSLVALETHGGAVMERERNTQVPAAASFNMPVWLSFFGIAILTSYLLLFHM